MQKNSFSQNNNLANDSDPHIVEKEPFSLDNFILQNKIGEGAFGKVFQVKNKKSGQIFAAKISITEINDISNDSLIDLYREIDIMSKIQHPSAIKFIGFSPTNFKGKSKPVIITEFAKNGTLSHFILKLKSNGQSNVINTQKLIIIYGIAAALSYLHSHDIIHRDLKPDNILLDDYLHPKIADFGLSKIVKQNLNMKSVQSIKGTPVYISPEIWMNYKYVKACDVYAFAFIIYELITTEKPFENENTRTSIMMKITNGDRPPFNKNIPIVYQNLIKICWSQEPEKRPSFDQILTQLRNNHDFITELVNEEEYRKYINYIDDFKISFNTKKKLTFTKSSIFNKKIQVYQKNDCGKIEKFSSIVGKFPFNFYKKLDDECKKIIEDAGDDCEKLFDIAVSFIEGHFHFPQNTSIGIKFLRESIKGNCLKSLNYYLNILIKGKIIPRNYKKAKKLITNCLKNDVGAQFLFNGKIFLQEKNYLLAKENFLKSFHLNNPESMYLLGKMIIKEYDLSANKKEAFDYFIKAIINGYSKAMLKYGLITKNEDNYKDEAIKYIEMAANNNNPKAQYCLSSIYEEGEIVPKDKEKSLQNLKIAAYNGHTDSMYKYGYKLSLVNGDQNHKINVLNFIKKASDKGHLDSINYYGVLIAKGYTDVANPRKGSRYIKISAKYKSTEGMFNYGYVLNFGIGIDEDKEKAIKYYKMSIDKGNINAMISYALMLKTGDGIPINLKEAAKYYKRAADKGSTQ